MKAAVPGCRRDLPPLGRGLFPRRPALGGGHSRSRSGRRRRAPTRCISRPGITARCPRRARMIPPMAYPDATFLDYAADVKQRSNVPVIAVGRLGDPALATERGRKRQGRFRRARPHAGRRSANGSTSSRAASRSRRCLACNTCIDEMRGGARLGCVVNGAAGRETLFASAKPPQRRAHRGDRRRPGRA